MIDCIEGRARMVISYEVMKQAFGEFHNFKRNGHECIIMVTLENGTSSPTK